MILRSPGAASCGLPPRGKAEDPAREEEEGPLVHPTASPPRPPRRSPGLPYVRRSVVSILSGPGAVGCQVLDNCCPYRDRLFLTVARGDKRRLRRVRQPLR